MYLFLTADHKIRPNDFKDGVARSINADRVLPKIMKEFKCLRLQGLKCHCKNNDGSSVLSAPSERKICV